MPFSLCFISDDLSLLTIHSFFPFWCVFNCCCLLVSFALVLFSIVFVESVGLFFIVCYRVVVLDLIFTYSCVVDVAATFWDFS